MAAESPLTVLVTSETGAEVDTSMTACDYANGSTFANDGTVVLLIQAAATCTLTVTGKVPCRFGIIHNTSYGPVTTGLHMVGPFAPNHYNDGYNTTHITWSGSSASNKVLAFKAGPCFD
jgi:hypothetical protein